MCSHDVNVLKHYVCFDCKRIHIRAVQMPLEDWQAFRDGLGDSDKRFTRVDGPTVTYHWYLDDLCADCHQARIKEEAELEGLLVPPVPQLMTWKQRIKRAFRKLFN